MSIEIGIVHEIQWDERGLIPAVVQDETTMQVLMLAHMNRDALLMTLAQGQAHFWSRSRHGLWKKGATSGHTMEVHEIRYDCDMDALVLLVKPKGSACHTGNKSCFFRTLYETSPIVTPSEEPREMGDEFLTELFALIQDRKANPRESSYTTSLFEKGQNEILKKLGEESFEIVLAAKNNVRNEMINEVCDMLYHLLVFLAIEDIALVEIYAELARRRRQ